jgi:hypothetical protein
VTGAPTRSGARIPRGFATPSSLPTAPGVSTCCAWSPSRAAPASSPCPNASPPTPTSPPSCATTPTPNAPVHPKRAQAPTSGPPSRSRTGSFRRRTLRRVVVLSDGVQTDGDALAEAHRAARFGVRVSVVPSRAPAPAEVADPRAAPARPHPRRRALRGACRCSPPPDAGHAHALPGRGGQRPRRHPHRRPRGRRAGAALSLRGARARRRHLRRAPPPPPLPRPLRARTTASPRRPRCPAARRCSTWRATPRGRSGFARRSQAATSRWSSAAPGEFPQQPRRDGALRLHLPLGRRRRESCRRGRRPRSGATSASSAGAS